MSGNSPFRAVWLMILTAGLSGCSSVARTNHAVGLIRASTSFTTKVAGMKVRLVAVVDTTSRDEVRLADHAWNPDGSPYEGPDRRLAVRNMAPMPREGTPLTIVFELEEDQISGIRAKERTKAPASRPVDTQVDAFCFLPRAASVSPDAAYDPGSCGPVSIRIWHGSLNDSSGSPVLAAPTSVAMGFGGSSSDPQPVDFGIAHGEYHITGKGSISVSKLNENQTTIVASGPWGKIEATHLRRPMAESAPSPTHRFRLLGAQFPPKSERKVLFYDATGTMVATCGDGPNNPGFAGRGFLSRRNISDIVRYEIYERPYEFVEFANVQFKAPSLNAISGNEGLNRAVDSPLGKALGVLVPTKDGAWSGAVLYAADGTRWVDPIPDLRAYEDGIFDPWNRPSDDNWKLLFKPIHEFSGGTTPMSCEIYAANTSDGPNKEKLTVFESQSLRFPISEIVFKPTARPFVRIELRQGTGGWKKLETIPVDDRMCRSAASGVPGTRVLEVFIDADGSIRIWKDEQTPVTSRATWSAGEQEPRIIAHLRNGNTVSADYNMAGYGGTPPNEKRYHGVEYTRQQNGTTIRSGRNRFDLADVASFEIQTQGYERPLTIPVHAPTK